MPKGLLPVAGRPVVQRIVDELAACGVERVVLVTGRERAAFAAHFDGAPGPEIVYAPQPRPLGLGDAILRAERHVRGPFVIALGDALLDGARVVERLLAAVRGGASAAVALEEVAPVETASYGIAKPAGEGEPMPLAGFVEKPAPGTAPSLLAAAGRYAATPALLDALRGTAPDPGGEIQLADALSALDGVVGVRLLAGEVRLDVGTLPGYCAAFVEVALRDPVLGPALRARARALLDDGER